MSGKNLRNIVLGKYFPHERREVKVEEFINLKQGNKSVEEYALKFSMLYRYSLFIVSNPRDEISRFVTGVNDLAREECRMVMLHDYIALARFMVYAQSIEESKHKMMSRNLKRSGSSNQDQSRFKKRAKTK